MNKQLKTTNLSCREIILNPNSEITNLFVTFTTINEFFILIKKFQAYSSVWVWNIIKIHLQFVGLIELLNILKY
jgi:hypothetical protein